jgi:8-oxo-dGTP pyrophosphatase MutT (NUDIX family)
VPAELLADYAGFLSGEKQPVEPRHASTVMLLRDSSYDDGRRLEVYMLRRHGAMPFAAGMYAYPGGRVDERDADADIGWAGPPAEEWAERLRCDPWLARALVCAAVRETFEESGVLLAGETPDTVVADTTDAGWETDRVALVERTLAMSDFLARRRLVLRTDLLALWAHWITPRFEPRRYDTRFFVAVLPAGQRTRDVSGESDQVTWVSPAHAVRGADDATMEMWPPTYVTLSSLTTYDAAADVLAAAADRRVETVVPDVELVDGIAYFSAAGWEGPQ